MHVLIAHTRTHSRRTSTTPARDDETSESTRTHLALDIHEARVRRLYETLELVLASFQSSRRVEEINVLRKNLRASRAKRRRPRSVSRVTHTMHRSIVGRRPARARRPPTPPRAHIAQTHNESSIHYPSTAPWTSHRPRRVVINPRHATRVSRPIPPRPRAHRPPRAPPTTRLHRSMYQPSTPRLSIDRSRTRTIVRLCVLRCGEKRRIGARATPRRHRRRRGARGYSDIRRVYTSSACPHIRTQHDIRSIMYACSHHTRTRTHAHIGHSCHALRT